MSNSKIFLLVFCVSVIAAVIAQYIATLVGLDSLFIFCSTATAIAALGAIIKQEQWSLLLLTIASSIIFITCLLN